MSEKIYYLGKRRNGIKRDVHRITMEEHVGRALDRSEVVHHIDGNIRNNRLENLKLMTLSAHSRMHMSGRRLSEETKRKLRDLNTGRPRPDKWVLTDSQLIASIQRHSKNESWRSIARSTGPSEAWTPTP